MDSLNIESNITHLAQGACKLHIVVTSENNMPDGVFAIEVLPKSRDPKSVNYRFSHVCSTAELVEFPPEEDPDMCYFRTNDIELVFDTITIAKLTEANIIKDINSLVLTWNQIHDIEIQGTTITISGTTESGTEYLDRVYYLRND